MPKQYLFEGTSGNSVSEGTAATTANTGASAITLNSGTATHKAVAAAQGPYGLEIVSTSGALAIIRTTSDSASGTMAYRIAFRTPAGPGADNEMFTLRHSAGKVCGGRWSTDGTLRIAPSSTGSTLATTVTMQALTWYEVALELVVGSDASTGKVNGAVFNKGSDTALATPFSSTTFNLGTNPITGGDAGAVTGVSGVAQTVYVDSIQYEAGRTSRIPAIVVTAAPSANVRPTSDVSNLGAWTIAGGTATRYEALADELTSTYVESPNSPSTAAEFIVGLGPMIDSVTASVSLDMQQSATGSGTCTVKLYEGATTRKTWTAANLTTDWETRVFALSQAEADTIVDWTVLRLGIAWVV